LGVSRAPEFFEDILVSEGDAKTIHGDEHGGYLFRNEAGEF